MRYSVIVCQDSSVFHDEVEADNQEEAERKARDMIADAWDLQSGLDEARAEGDETGFDAGFDGFAVDLMLDQPAPDVGELAAAGDALCEIALAHLRAARDIFKAIDNKRTVERIRSAISSAKGAVRIHEYRETRWTDGAEDIEMGDTVEWPVELKPGHDLDETFKLLDAEEGVGINAALAPGGE